MKKTIFIISTVAASAFAFTSCDKGDGTAEPVFAAASIADAAKDLTANINSYVPVDLIWTSGSWNGEGGISYRALVDRENGDFSEPLLELVPEEGTLSVFITQAQMTDIWETVAGPEDPASREDQTAVIKWAVETTAGENTVLSGSQKIILTKEYIENIPFEAGMPLFLAGDGAAEAGQEMSCIHDHPFKTEGANYSDNHGHGMDVDYEVYTTFDAGEPVYLAYGDSFTEPDGYLTFPDAEFNTPGSYECVTEIPQDGFTADEASVYRIRIDAAGSQVLIQKINSVKIRCFGREPNKNGKYVAGTTTDFDMTYSGKGVWTCAGFDLKWGGDTFDSRFDGFKFFVEINGESGQTLYGHSDDGTIANPATAEEAASLQLRLVAGGGATNKSILRYPLSLISDTVNPAYSADVVLHLNLDNGNFYYHEFTNATAK